jgi:arsenate reductase|tara:strand:+ start:3211 stop:3570 length:360 start_codon:yes stop_codon:yes gene_type:complete
MHYDKSELTIIYNSNKIIDKKTLAIAQGISSHINKQDINEVRLSNTLFRLAVEKLNIKAKDIMDKSSPYYQENIKGRDPDIDSAYYMIMNNPKLLKSPIALFKGKVVLCCTPSDVLKVC